MTKVISLSNEAYFRLKNLKHGEDSFSDVVLKLVEKPKQNIMDFFGKWPGTDEEALKIKGILEKERKQVKTREVHF